MSSTLSASHLDSIKSTLLDQALRYRNVFMDKVFPRLTKQSRATYIAAAIGIFVAAKFYSIFAYPRNLRHIKHAPLLPYLASFIKKDTTIHRAKRFIIPGYKESNGFMVVYDQFGWTINVSNPEAVKTILYKTDIFPKNDNNDMMPADTLIRKFFGTTNLALANGHEWMKRRKIANPVFHRSMPVKTFTHLTEKLIKQIDNTEGQVPIQPLLQRFTLDAIGLVGFGFDFNAIETPDGEWVTTYNAIADNIADFQFLFFPTFDTTLLNLFPARQKQHKNVEKMDKLFYSIIEHKKKALSKAKSDVEEGEKDLLTLMIEAGHDENDKLEPLTSSELRDELVVFFLAG
jgi:cytochrome P450